MSRNEWSKMLKIYIREKSRGWISLGISCLLFVFLFYVYGLPMQILFYGFFLCFFIGGLFLLYDFYAGYKRKRALLQCGCVLNYELPSFPEPRIWAEADYQEMLHRLYEKYLQAVTNRTETDREREDYYTMWAHQIKTPISAMRLLLQTDDRADSQQLSAELFKISQYTEMALQYLRMESMSTDFSFQSCSVSKLVKQVIRKYSVLFIRKKIRLEWTETDQQVVTDEKWLGFMLEQILSNAIQYTPSGGTIRIEMKEDGAEQVLMISDTGIGICAEDLPRIFEKGFTGCNGSMDKKSTGIGLYLCRKISEKLGHTLAVQSEIGSGTQVSIRFASPKGHLFE